MNELKIFNFEESEIRTMVIEKEPWFVGKDVAEVLGYSNAPDALAKHVDAEDKQNLLKSQNATLEIPNRGLTLINESGLYSLIMSSKLPTAKAFKRWVTGEVLPALRKTGRYALQDSYLIEDPIERAERWIEEQKEKQALLLTTKVQGQQIAELQPKASYYDIVLNSPDLISISKIAKDFGKSAVWMNRFLHEKGVQYKEGSIWLLYQKYAEKGYTHTKTAALAGTDGQIHSKPHTYWTQQGRLFIYDLMKNSGYLPTVEMEGSNA